MRSSPPSPVGSAPARSQTVSTADGRSLHAIVHGQGPDLVVLEAGMGAAAASWGGVLDELGPGVRAVAYDRAGYGRSETAPGSRDLDALAADLVDVVAAFPHERLVLVGHSWGGPVVRLAVERLRARGEEVSGAVLVDPAEELADLYFTRIARMMNRAQGVVLPALAQLRLLAPLQRSAAAVLPAAYRDEAAEAVSTSTAARAIRAESAHITRGLQLLRLDRPEPLGVPVVVLSGREPEGLGRRMRDELSTAHRARAAFEAGRYIAAEKSGHVIGASEPHLVSVEILRLLR
ncbi:MULTISPECIES: alpha/beta fold hydrolase [unclassified Brachybacterium]|uniref:alpha/beta fold hydrolase n=1 Tax=unclassified Brachybacterium TaxID=2623841 RepID=UPI004033C98A